MGKRGKHNWSKEKLPLGTVRIRKKNGKRWRMIKARHGGPISGRWVGLARHWWENNRGPVPDGMRVCHEDGDSLNDDPSNYVLLTAGDVVFVAHERDPEMSRRNYAACREATARMNREKAAIRRQKGWLDSRWYPVDQARRVIVNQPFKKAWMVHGPGYRPVSRNGRGADGAVLGWPTMPRLAACFLHVLSVGGDMTAEEIVHKATAMRLERGWGDEAVTIGAFYSFSSVMRRREWIVRFRPSGIRGKRRYRITKAAMAERCRPSPYTAVRGADLRGPEFLGYARESPGVDDEAMVGKVAVKA